MPHETLDLLDVASSVDLQPIVSGSEPPQRARVGSTFFPAFGVATLCWLPVLGAIASPTHETLYHLYGPVSALIVPALCNLFLLAFLLTLCLRWARHIPRLDATFWIILLGATPSIALRNVSLLYGFHPSRILNLTVFAVCFVSIVIFSWLWTPARSSRYARARRIGASVHRCLAG
jgi:hypothetical protein